MSDRIAWIDSAKAIGILLVVWGHALPSVGVLPAVIWTFHMPLFFFLSGLTARAGSTLNTAAIRRSATSLLIPYFVFSILSIVLWLTFTGQLSSTATWARVGGEMAYGISGDSAVMRYNTPLWFFTCLLSVRLLFICLTFRGIKPAPLALLTTAVAIGAHLLFAIGLPRLPWNIDVAFVALAFYCAGHLAKQAGWSAVGIGVRRIWPAAAISAICLIAVVIANGRVDMNGRSFGNPPLFYFGAFAGIFLAVIVAKSVDGLRWIARVGGGIERHLPDALAAGLHRPGAHV